MGSDGKGGKTRNGEGEAGKSSRIASLPWTSEEDAALTSAVQVRAPAPRPAGCLWEGHNL